MQETRALTAEQVIAALNATKTVAEAAKRLGVSERTLYRRMGDFRIRVERRVVEEAA